MNYKDEKICVLGLGYVGLTLSLTLTNFGKKVVGIETNANVIDSLKNNEPHFFEAGLKDSLVDAKIKGSFEISNNISEASDCTVFIISVGTPLDERGFASFDSIDKCIEDIISIEPDNPLIVVRSTVKIGTTRNRVAKILSQSNLSFQIAMCPERTAEGKAMTEITLMPQIIGGLDSESAKRAQIFFSDFNKNTLVVSNPETAELIKLVDNSTRDLSFAVSNEIANISEVLGLDVYEVITNATEKYERTNIPLPGLVGGPCLEKDPHILYQSLKDFDYSANLFKEAREVNENMAKAFLPWVSGLNHSSSYGIAGLAFKGNPETSDLRGSLSIEIFNELKDKSTNEINLFDPVKEVIKTQDYENFFSKGKWFENFEQFVVETDILIICNNHSFFKNLLNANKIWDLNPNIEIYDFWNNLSEKLTKENLYKYKVFGRAQKND